MLEAGDRLRIAASGRTVRERTEAEATPAWLHGQLAVRDRPVREIVDELRRYFNGAIVLQDEAFAERRVSGLYDLRHPVATLQSLAASHDAAVTSMSPWVVIIRANPSEKKIR